MKLQLLIQNTKSDLEATKQSFYILLSATIIVPILVGLSYIFPIVHKPNEQAILVIFGVIWEIANIFFTISFKILIQHQQKLLDRLQRIH